MYFSSNFSLMEVWRPTKLLFKRFFMYFLYNSDLFFFSGKTYVMSTVFLSAFSFNKLLSKSFIFLLIRACLCVSTVFSYRYYGFMRFVKIWIIDFFKFIKSQIQKPLFESVNCFCMITSIPKFPKNTFLLSAFSRKKKNPKTIRLSAVEQ